MVRPVRRECELRIGVPIACAAPGPALRPATPRMSKRSET